MDEKKKKKYEEPELESHENLNEVTKGMLSPSAST